MSPVDVRPAGADDAQDVAAIAADALHSPWDARAIADLVAEPSTIALVATAPRGISGFVLGRVAADEAEILLVAVRPGARRRGVASRLLGDLGGLAAGRGARRVFLEVDIGNAGAISFYDRLGFAEVGRRKDYYRRAGQPTSDALVLARELPAGVG